MKNVVRKESRIDNQGRTPSFFFRKTEQMLRKKYVKIHANACNNGNALK